MWCVPTVAERSNDCTKGLRFAHFVTGVIPGGSIGAEFQPDSYSALSFTSILGCPNRTQPKLLPVF